MFRLGAQLLSKTLQYALEMRWTEGIKRRGMGDSEKP